MEQREFNLNGRHADVVGSANNKAKMYLGQPIIGLRRYGWETSTEGSLGRKTGEEEKEKEYKVEEFQLVNLARPSQAIKELLGMLARLPWGRGDMLGPLYTSPGWLQPASEGQPLYSQSAISIYMTARANPGQPFLPGNPSRDLG